ncbi:ABC transporter [Nitzschia inconspicua]|uniref:ABC transporter n=1 Tax=Nitzschia inconspicua TaxID=303405 RepID=A0A9K3M6G7_9STRA|nr:ABC transporter [Nitzschia inconspicua]
MTSEEELVSLLSGVLLQEDQMVDGLDEDLVQYIAGLLSTQLQDGNDVEETLEESMVPFLDSVGCPSALVEKARAAIVHHYSKIDARTSTSSDDLMAKKLKQGIVNMSSTLSEQTNMEDTNSMWNASNKTLKANANSTIDAYHDKTSAKDRRKQRQDLEKQRRDLERQQQQHTEKNTKAGVSTMVLPTMKGKDMDINLPNITLSLDNGTSLLEQGDLKFAYRRRYAIIGENGVGKTTLLNRIANWQDLEGFPQHLRVLHVKQELGVPDSTTVLDAVLEADIERTTLLREEKEISARLEGAGVNGSEEMTIEAKQKLMAEKGLNVADDQFAKDLKQLKDIYDRLTLLGADNAQSRAATILSGLQFTEEMQSSPIKSLSGGWRMRVALAAALLITPDLLMLDEPTNHLDLEAVLWLEAHLQQYPHTVIIVSHDRGFLNEVCTDTIEFKNKKLTYYRGNFDTFVKLKEEKMKNAMREYQAYQRKRDHMMEFIEKFRANAKRATMVQSRIKAVEKMDAEAPEPVEMDSTWRFSIPSSEPLGRPIIAIDDVSFDYNVEKPDGSKKKESEYLLQKVNFGVDNNSKIAILGANGQGKTTLLNLIMGHLRPLSGHVTVNSGLRIGHFTQHHSERFDLSLSAVENMLNIFDSAEDQEMRNFLGKFQIQGVDALKPMRLLSGGQKSRVSFAALAYQRPHLLIIDEGSNHLSMDAVDALVQAIQDFQGGLLIVSHDQYFVSKCASELWVVEEGHATRFRGDFNDYKEYTAKKTKKRVEESLKKIGNISN